MPTLGERLTGRRRVRPNAEAERLAAQIWSDRIALAAAKHLLKRAQEVLPEGELRAAVATFLERHP